MGKQKGRKRKKQKVEESDDEDFDNSLQLSDFQNCFFTDHGLPDDPIEKVIAKVIKEHGFPHPHHFENRDLSHVPTEDSSRYKRGSFTETEKDILSRNFEIIMHCPKVKQFWNTMEEKDQVIIGLFGYCSSSKYFDSPFRTKDIFPTPKEILEFRFNLCRGLPDRSIFACYSWVRRTYNPWLCFTDKDYSDAVEHAREIVKKNPERFLYSDVSAKNHVDLRSVQTIYQCRLTGTGEDPIKNPFTPEEDFMIVEAIRKQAGVDTYEQLLQLDKFKARFLKISREMGVRAVADLAIRWRKLREELRSDVDVAKLAKIARHYKRDLARMIYCLYREADEYESQVDWHSLAVGDLTFKICVHRFRHLKTWVPDKVIAKKSHRKIVKWLYKHMLPSFVSMSEKRMQKLEAFYRSNFFYNH